MPSYIVRKVNGTVDAPAALTSITGDLQGRRVPGASRGVRNPVDTSDPTKPSYPDTKQGQAARP